MFFANGIERLREGGRLCLITNDSFRTLTTHASLRRHMLDHCKIVEILLTDTRHFEGVSFQFAGMAITTLEKCSDPEARRGNLMRLVDLVRDPLQFAAPPADRVSEWRQEDYEALRETPFFVGVPREVFAAARRSGVVRDVARGRQGLAAADDGRFLAAIDEPRVVQAGVAVTLDDDERRLGIPPDKPNWVPFAKGEGYGEYWREPGVVIDWSQEPVTELERRSRFTSGTPRKTYFRNRELYFRAGLTYSVISSGRVSARLMPEGWIFGHKGSAIFTEDEQTSERFLLGYLNSFLATYFMKKLVNTTATADVGYVEKLPYRRPAAELEANVVERVDRIVAALQVDREADVTVLRQEIDDLIFDLFEVRTRETRFGGSTRRSAARAAPRPSRRIRRRARRARRVRDRSNAARRVGRAARRRTFRAEEARAGNARRSAFAPRSIRQGGSRSRGSRCPRPARAVRSMSCRRDLGRGSCRPPRGSAASRSPGSTPR